MRAWILELRGSSTTLNFSSSQFYRFAPVYTPFTAGSIPLTLDIAGVSGISPSYQEDRTTDGINSFGLVFNFGKKVLPK